MKTGKPGRKPIKRRAARSKFSRTLAALTKKHGLAAAELARRAAIHRSLMSRIATGQTYMVDGAHVTKIMGAFRRREDRAKLLAAYARDCLDGCGRGAAMLVRVTVK